MTDQEAIEGYEARAQKTGRPTWPGASEQLTLFGTVIRGDREAFISNITPHEVLCLWRDHVREWLVKNAVEEAAVNKMKWLSSEIDYDSALLGVVDALEVSS